MIGSFRCKHTAALYLGQRVARFANIERVALRKLRQIEIAARLNDLRIPPSNHLEPLQGDRDGQYSLRINDQWRLCFTWHEGHAHLIEIIDYH